MTMLAGKAHPRGDGMIRIRRWAGRTMPKFALGVSDSSTTSTVWPLASLVGALCGGVLADWAARHRQGDGSWCRAWG